MAVFGNGKGKTLKVSKTEIFYFIESVFFLRLEAFCQGDRLLATLRNLSGIYINIPPITKTKTEHTYG
jgi:hypothetical protein